MPSSTPSLGNGDHAAVPLPHAHRIVYHGDPAYPLRNGAPDQPIRAIILTSVRDVLGDDRNGQCIDTEHGRRYMEGATERLIRETRRGGVLHDILRVVSIVTDDTPKDGQRRGIPLVPTPGHPWIHPLDLADGSGKPVIRDNFTHWIPSRFRDLPANAVRERTHLKREFESQVLLLMHQKSADILLSDHLMLRCERIVFANRGRIGRALNIHPAVTLPDHPCRFPGKSPTQDAIDRADAGVPTFTGATLHIMDPEIDHGPVIAYSASTPVHPGHDPMTLRYDNYRHAKLHVLMNGLRHYIRHIYPHLDTMDISALLPLNDVTEPALA